MTHEETIERYQVGDKVYMYDGAQVHGEVVRVPADGGEIVVQWSDITDPCNHFEDEFPKIKNVSLSVRIQQAGLQFNRVTYKEWHKRKLGLTDGQKAALQKELERLANRDEAVAISNESEYHAGRADAFGAIWKLIEGTFDETDYCP